MAVLTGMLTAPIAGRFGAALPYPKKWWAVWMDQSVGWRSRYWQRFRTRWWRHCAGSLVFVSAQRCRADHTFAVAPVTPSHIPIGVYLKA